MLKDVGMDRVPSIEDLIKRKPNNEWIRMSQETSAEALALEKKITKPAQPENPEAKNLEDSFPVSLNWVDNADGEILKRIDEITAGFGTKVDLRAVFRYRAMVKLLGAYFGTNIPGPDITRRYRNKIIDDCAAAQARAVHQSMDVQAVLKTAQRAGTVDSQAAEAVRAEVQDLQEAQKLLLDVPEIFCNAAGVAMVKLRKEPVKPF